MAYELVFSCKREHTRNILSWEPSKMDKLFHTILKEKCFKNPRVTFKDNKYRYYPTDDYKSYVLKFRGVRK